LQFNAVPASSGFASFNFLILKTPPSITKPPAPTKEAVAPEEDIQSTTVEPVKINEESKNQTKNYHQ
jgi:hypothetical protein